MSKNEKESQPTKEDTTLEKINKFLALANSKFGVRVFSVATLSLALAGIASPLIPVAATPILITGLAAVAVGVVADTLQIRYIRLLQKESHMLLKSQESKLAQDKILATHPTLQNILKGQLVEPARGNQKSITERYATADSSRLAKAANISSKLNDNFGIVKQLVKNINKEGFFNLPNTVAEIGIAAYTLIAGKERKEQTNTVKNVLEQKIDKLRDQNNTPGYNDLRELKGNVREQRIQQLALQKLVTDYPELIIQTTKGHDTHHLNPQKLEEQIQKKFTELKVEIASKEKAVSARPFFAEVKSYMRDMWSAHDPYSQYYDVNAGKVKIPELNPKTNKVEKVEFKAWEKAKEVEKAKETKAAEKAKKAEKKAKKEAKLERKVDERVKKIMGKIDSHRDNRKSSAKVKPSSKRNKRNKSTHSRGK